MILQFFAAFIGAAGFGFLFHLQFKHIFPAALGGVLTWVIYVIANIWGFDVFISSLFASAFAAIYSEVIAKIRKAPTTLFLIISVVVLIPGGSLYYTMSYAVQRQWQYAATYGSKTVQCTLGLAIGMSLIWIFHDMRLIPMASPNVHWTCHRNEPHMDISRYGKKGLLFNSLGENRRKKK